MPDTTRNAPANTFGDLVSKLASLKDAIEKAGTADAAGETPDEARARRVAEMVRRRQPSGLATGSADPTPPGDMR